jgi:hypothetical protein
LASDAAGEIADPGVAVGGSRAKLKQCPSAWMPWNYRNTLALLARPAAA